MIALLLAAALGAPVSSAWADDMEWGAAELFRATAEPAYLADAVRYADLAGSVSWMGRLEAGHYALSWDGIRGAAILMFERAAPR